MVFVFLWLISLSIIHSCSNHLFYQAPPALITPKPGTKQPGTASMPPSPLTLFKLANPKPAYPASPVPSHGDHNKGCDSFPLVPGASLCGPHGVARPCLQIYKYNKLPFRWQLSPDWLALPYLNSNKTYIKTRNSFPWILQKSGRVRQLLTTSSFLALKL